MHERGLLYLAGGVLALLLVGSLIGWGASRRPMSEASRATGANLNSRMRAWGIMTAVFGLALATGGIGSIVLFGFTSVTGLREVITLPPTRHGGHRAFFLAFLLVT